MAVIRVPKTPKRAFNKNRPISTLLKSQLDQLEWAVRPASQRKPYQLPKTSVRTEGEAAERIGELTRRLHPEGAKTSPTLAEPQAARARPKKKRAKSRPRSKRSH
jgi:hypothetical protein